MTHAHRLAHGEERAVYSNIVFCMARNGVGIFCYVDTWIRGIDVSQRATNYSNNLRVNLIYLIFVLVLEPGPGRRKCVAPFHACAPSIPKRKREYFWREHLRVPREAVVCSSGDTLPRSLLDLFFASVSVPAVVLVSTRASRWWLASCSSTLYHHIQICMLFSLSRLTLMRFYGTISMEDPKWKMQITSKLDILCFLFTKPDYKARESPTERESSVEYFSGIISVTRSYEMRILIIYVHDFAHAASLFVSAANVMASKKFQDERTGTGIGRLKWIRVVIWISKLLENSWSTNGYRVHGTLITFGRKLLVSVLNGFKVASSV